MPLHKNVAGLISECAIVRVLGTETFRAGPYTTSNADVPSSPRQIIFRGLARMYSMATAVFAFLFVYSFGASSLAMPIIGFGRHHLNRGGRITLRTASNDG